MRREPAWLEAEISDAATRKEGTKRWLAEQKRLSEDLKRAAQKYEAFHLKGFEVWFMEWLKQRRIK